MSVETLCWDCRRSILECPWLRDGEPVPGWDAEATVIRHARKGHKPSIIESWQVRFCPLHVPPVQKPKAPPRQYQYKDARYERLVKSGLCTSCGKRPPRPGKTKCKDCAELANRRVRIWHMKRKVQKDENH